MAIFSVYDYDRRIFDYYESPGSHQGLGTVKFSSFRKVSKIPGETDLGAIPESIAEPLPTNSIKIGEGDMPKGVIAIKKKMIHSIEGLAPGKGDLGKFAVYGVAVFSAWKIWKKFK